MALTQSRQSDVEKLREEAISKLEKPLEKMRIKELKQLLQVYTWHKRMERVKLELEMGSVMPRVLLSAHGEPRVEQPFGSNLKSTAHEVIDRWLSTQERGVTYKACSEKAQLLQTVRESIHLPVKKEHLNKFANMP